MKIVRMIVAALALGGVVGLVVNCGSSANPGRNDSPAAGRLRVALDSSVPMATIVVRNVFDPQQVAVVDCAKKDHLLDGGQFCDELLVLPPGVYEVVVQSHEGCQSEQDHYKVVVTAGTTTELTVNMICGVQNGALDTVVTSTEFPTVTGLDFTFANTGEPANKFVCQCALDFTQVTATVFDSDNACDQLTGTFTATNSQGQRVNPLSIFPAAGGTLPDMLLSADVPGGYDLQNANDPAHLIFSATGTNQFSAVSEPDGGTEVFPSTDWHLTWNAATQSGTFNVTDVSDAGFPQPLLTGTVSDFFYTPGPGGFATLDAVILMNPNSLGFPPAPAENLWRALTDLTEADGGDPSHLTGPSLGNELSDLSPIQLQGTATDGGCAFPVLLDTTLPLGDYAFQFTVTDPTGLTGTLNFPVHFINCGVQVTDAGICPPQ